MTYFKSIFFSLTFLLGSLNLMAQGPCDADHNVLLTDFSFTPDSLVILPGETVAFINIQGTHSVTDNRKQFVNLYVFNISLKNVYISLNAPFDC